MTAWIRDTRALWVRAKESRLREQHVLCAKCGKRASTCTAKGEPRCSEHRHRAPGRPRVVVIEPCSAEGCPRLSVGPSSSDQPRCVYHAMLDRRSIAS